MSETSSNGIRIARSLEMSENARDRIGVELHEHASQRQHRELRAFVRYCVFRIEREFGELQWLVRILPDTGGFGCYLVVNVKNRIIEARGRGFDGALAAWDALSNAEQALRESRQRRTLVEIDHVFALDRTSRAR